MIDVRDKKSIASLKLDEFSSEGQPFSFIVEDKRVEKEYQNLINQKLRDAAENYLREAKSYIIL